MLARAGLLYCILAPVQAVSDPGCNRVDSTPYTDAEGDKVQYKLQTEAGGNRTLLFLVNDKYSNSPTDTTGITTRLNFRQVPNGVDVRNQNGYGTVLPQTYADEIQSMAACAIPPVQVGSTTASTTTGEPLSTTTAGPEPTITPGQCTVSPKIFPAEPVYLQKKRQIVGYTQDKSMCPVTFPNTLDSFKSAIAAAAAITTPPLGIAGRRTLQMKNFLDLDSSDFTCVPEGDEVKLRPSSSLEKPVQFRLDDTFCTMKDISIYQTKQEPGSPVIPLRSSGEMYVRLDFTCEGKNVYGRDEHSPEYAAINMAIEDEDLAFHLPGTTEKSADFTEFFKAICIPGHRKAFFKTGNLKGFAGTHDRKPGLPPRPVDKIGPKCFAQSGSALHAFSKTNCFKDFLWLDFVNNKNLASIPGSHDVIQREMARLKVTNAGPVYNQSTDGVLWEGGGEANRQLLEALAPTPAPTPAFLQAQPKEDRRLGPCDPATPPPTPNTRVPATVMTDRVCICFEGHKCSNDCSCKNQPLSDQSSFWWLPASSDSGNSTVNLANSTRFWQPTLEEFLSRTPFAR